MNSQTRVAVLIHHPEDLDWIRHSFSNNPVLVTHESYLQFLLKHHNLKFINFNKKYSSKDYEDIDYFLSNWYRDISGVDIYHRDGVSWPQVLTGSLFFTAVNVFRDFNALSELLKNVDKLYVSVNESNQFKSICAFFSEKIEYYSPFHSYKSIIQSSNERNLIPNESKGIRALFIYCARVLQKPFLPFLSNKTILFSDWTTECQRKKMANILTTKLSINIFKTIYASSGNIVGAERAVYRELKPIVSKDSLAEAMSRIDVSWEEGLLLALANHINERFLKNREFFVDQYAYFTNILDTYRPSRVILPAETYEPYTLLLQLAQARGIETTLLFDGIMSTTCASSDRLILLRFRDAKNKKYLFDSVIAAGQSNYDYFKLSAYTENNIFLIKPPILDWHNNTYSPHKKRFDVILMTLIVNDLNPSGYNASRFDTLKEMLEVVRDLGLKKIGIKIKSDSEFEWVKILISSLGMTSQCEILEGFFYKHVQSADLVVCGFSTGVLETAYHGIPCIVYEPFVNGYTDKSIDASLSVGSDKVARTPAELKALLLSRASSVIGGFDYLFDGPELYKIPLLKIN